MLPNCPDPGVIVIGLSNELLCQNPADNSTVAWEGHVPASDFTPDMIDAVTASEAFGAGFAVYAAYWVVASGVVLAVRAFQKL